MMNLVLSLIGNVISLGVFLYFIQNCLCIETMKKKDICIIVMIFLFKLCCLTFRVPILNLLNTMVMYVYILKLAKGVWIKKIWFLAIFMALSVLSEEAGMYINEMFLQEVVVDLGIFISVLISKILLMALVYIVIIICNLIENHDINYKNIFVLLLFPLSSIAILVSIRYPIMYHHTNLFFLFSLVLLIFANIGCFFEYYLWAKHSRIKMENTIMKDRLYNSKKYIELYKNKTDKDRGIIHDIKKHLQFLQSLLIDHKEAEALNYLKEVVNDINTNREIITGNIAFDIALNMYMDKIKQLKISLDYSGIQKVDLSWIILTDQCTIFANLIENAVESCEKTNRPKIIFILKELDNKIIFQMKNSCNEKDVKDVRCTTKSDTNWHGYGLKNVKLTLDKYDAKLTTKIHLPTSQFITIIIFHKMNTDI